MKGPSHNTLRGISMLSYEFYKIAHILAVVVFFSGSAVALYSEAQKHVKIISGVASFLIFVAGMGLLARIGLDHGAGFPFWVWAKMAIWLFLAVALPVGAKRAPKNMRLPIFGIGLTLLVVSHYLAMYKPS